MLGLDLILNAVNLERGLDHRYHGTYIRWYLKKGA